MFAWSSWRVGGCVPRLSSQASNGTHPLPQSASLAWMFVHATARGLGVDDFEPEEEPRRTPRERRSPMRNPVRSEADAFHLVVAIGVVVVVSVALGALVSPLLGVVLLGVALAAGMFWELRTKDPERRQPLREAHTHGRGNQPGNGNRVLVVANRTLASDSLRSEIRRRAEDGAEIHVVAPILCSRLHYIATDVDRELRDARERLNDTLDALREQGVQLTGTVGDPNVALGAIEDELRRGGGGGGDGGRVAAGGRGRGADLDAPAEAVELARDRHRHPPARGAGHSRHAPGRRDGRSALIRQHRRQPEVWEQRRAERRDL